MRAIERHLTIALLLLGGTFATATERVLPPVKLGAVRREPVAAAKDPEHPCVAIACAKSGTLLFWNVEKRETEAEFKLGSELRGVEWIGLNQHLLIDSKNHELIQIRYEKGRLTELRRYPVPPHPVAFSRWFRDDEIFVAIASLWSRQVSIWRTKIEVKNEVWQQIGDFAQVKVVDLPFEPRLISYARPDHLGDADAYSTLQVAAAFGGGLAEIDLRTWKVRAWEQPIHNIGSLEIKNGSGGLLTHQTLNTKLPITEASLTSGEFLQNRVSQISCGQLWKITNLLRLEKLGEQVDAFDTTPRPLAPYLELKADPAGVADFHGGWIVCLAGVNEVALFANSMKFVRRFPVGKRPRSAVNLDYRHTIVLGELDDSVTLFDATDVRSKVDDKFIEDWGKVKATTHLLDPDLADRELGPAERGERLFFSAKMSAGGMMSCHSCHTDGHTNGLLADTLGDNTHGTPKRVLTLRGTRLTDLWSWNGEMKTLQDNVFKSLKDTMHAPEIKPADVDDIVSFLHTLPPVPPLKPVPQNDEDLAQLARGEKIFQREKCGSCHVPPLTFTSHAVYDVGLADEKGLRKFNPPSLRGVGRLKKLFHDNRASSLRDVFETHGHQLAEPLPVKELDDLLRYLESL